MAPFIDNFKFPVWNLNINDLILIIFLISLIKKRCFWSFDLYSDKTVTLSDMLPNINKFRNEIMNFSESFTNLGSKLFELLWNTSWIILFFFKCTPVNSSQFFFNGPQNWVCLLILYKQKEVEIFVIQYSGRLKEYKNITKCIILHFQIYFIL